MAAAVWRVRVAAGPAMVAVNALVAIRCSEKASIAAMNAIHAVSFAAITGRWLRWP